MRRASLKTSLSVANLTEYCISATLEDHTSASILTPRVTTSFGELSLASGTTLTLETYINGADSVIERYQLGPWIPGGQQWEPIACASKLWHIYRVELRKGHHRIVILQDRPLDSWMRNLPDAVSLADVCLPGTHETMALYGWPFSQCQDITLSEQLISGVRMLDIRIILYKGKLVAFHGATPERATFGSILSDVCSFIRSPAGRQETVIMSIMEEDSFLPSSPQFSHLVHDAIFSPPSYRDLWYLENRIPTLGEVRGKIVLFSRFGKDGEGWEGGLNGIGIHPPIWPDSRREGFEWEMENARVRVQDWYDIPSFLSIPEKAKVAVEMLHPKPAPTGKQDLAITFLSAARIPFALPTTVACGFGWSHFLLGVEGVNSRVGKWLLRQLAGGDVGEERLQPLRPQRTDTQETLINEDESEAPEKKSDRPTDDRLRGWVLMDFVRYPCDLGIIPLLIEFNEFKTTRD